MPAVLVSAWILLAALPVTAQEWFDALIARVEGQPVLVSDVTTHQILFGDGVAYPNRDPAQREAAPPRPPRWSPRQKAERGVWRRRREQRRQGTM